MPKFSKNSLKHLSEAHPKLQKIFNEVIKHYDCVVIEGHRPQQEQNEVFKAGKSKVQWPNSKHNTTPSMAVDVCPYPIVWTDTKSFYFLGGYVKAVADMLNIKIRWGGDWNGNNIFSDQTFNDLPHFELHPDELSKTQDVLHNGPSVDEINEKLKSME